MLVEHLRTNQEDREPIATLVGMNVDGKVVIGWSKRHPTCDPCHFEKRIGRNWAKLRALAEGKVIQRQTKPVSCDRYPEFDDKTTVFCQVNAKGECKVIPHVFQHGALEDFMDRCKIYYKVDEISNVVG